MSQGAPNPNPYGDRPLQLLTAEVVLDHTLLLTREDNFPKNGSDTTLDMPKAVLEFSAGLGSMALHTFRLLKEQSKSGELPESWHIAQTDALIGYVNHDINKRDTTGKNTAESIGILVNRGSNTVCLWQRVDGEEEALTRTVLLPTKPLADELRATNPREWVCGAASITYDDGVSVLRKISPFLLPGFNPPGERSSSSSLRLYAIQARFAALAVIPPAISSLQQP